MDTLPALAILTTLRHLEPQEIVAVRVRLGGGGVGGGGGPGRARGAR